MLPVAADPARMPRVGYAVAAGHPLAVDEADRALRKGANAVEAALVAAFVQGVVDPAKCGIGGWGGAPAGPPDGGGALNDISAAGPGRARPPQLGGRAGRRRPPPLSTLPPLRDD